MIKRTFLQFGTKDPSPKADTARKPHFEFSKFCVVVVLMLCACFLWFTCYEIHMTGDLSAVGYIATGVLVCLGIIVNAYMKRAYQKDLVNLEIEKAKKLTVLKKKYGDDFVYERIDDVDLSV